MEGSIYVVKNNQSDTQSLVLHKIAYFMANSITMVNYTNNCFIDGYNRQVANFIAKSKSDKHFSVDRSMLYKVIAMCGDIIGILLHYIQYRRCTGYVILQVSSLGSRIMVYFDDVIVHFATSFGTTCDYAVTKLDEQIIEIINDVKKETISIPFIFDKLNGQLTYFI